MKREPVHTPTLNEKQQFALFKAKNFDQLKTNRLFTSEELEQLIDFSIKNSKHNNFSYKYVGSYTEAIDETPSFVLMMLWYLAGIAQFDALRPLQIYTLLLSGLALLVASVVSDGKYAELDKEEEETLEDYQLLSLKNHFAKEWRINHKLAPIQRGPERDVTPTEIKIIRSEALQKGSRIALTAFTYFNTFVSVIDIFKLSSTLSMLTGAVGIGVAVSISIGIGIYCGYKFYEYRYQQLNSEISKECEADLFEQQYAICRRFDPDNRVRPRGIRRPYNEENYMRSASRFFQSAAPASNQGASPCGQTPRP